MSPYSKSASKAPYDPYFGRKDLCLHVERTVRALFPKPASLEQLLREQSRSNYDEFSRVGGGSASSSSETLNETMELEYDVPEIAQWVAYILYRTDLPQAFVFHSLHLLRHVAALPHLHSHTLVSPLFHPTHPISHHSLILTSLHLSTSYLMDDAYSSKSWTIASKDLFTVGEVTEMQLDMLRSLNFALRADGEDLAAILEEDELEWREQVYAEKVAAERRKLEEFSRAKALGQKLGSWFPRYRQCEDDEHDDPSAYGHSSSSPPRSRTTSCNKTRDLSQNGNSYFNRVISA